jgi:hypothetical protein
MTPRKFRHLNRNFCLFCLFFTLKKSNLHWLADSIFTAQFTVKNVVCFLDIFHWKKWWNFQSFFTSFQLSFKFFTSNRKSGENALGFPPSFQLKIDGKQTRFFTENSTEKFEFSNQCWGLHDHLEVRRPEWHVTSTKVCDWQGGAWCVTADLNKIVQYFIFS